MVSEFPSDLVKLIINMSQDPILATRVSGTCRKYREYVKKLAWVIAWKAYNIDVGLYQASVMGNRRLVDLFIHKGANLWMWGLEGAVWGGRRELVEFFQAKINEENV